MEKVNLTKILAVSGLPGLYELIANRPDGAIIKDLEKGLNKFAPLRKHQFSLLESISIFTHKDSTPLTEIFASMHDAEAAIPENNADNASVLAYFKNILPDYDPDRVSLGDIKKVIKWYRFLEIKDLIKEEAKEVKEQMKENEKP